MAVAGKMERNGSSWEPLQDRIHTGWLLDSEDREEMEMVLWGVQLNGPGGSGHL